MYAANWPRTHSRSTINYVTKIVVDAIDHLVKINVSLEKPAIWYVHVIHFSMFV